MNVRRDRASSPLHGGPQGSGSSSFRQSRRWCRFHTLCAIATKVRNSCAWESSSRAFWYRFPPCVICCEFLVKRGILRPIPKVESLGLYWCVLSRGSHFCDRTNYTPFDKKLGRGVFSSMRLWENETMGLCGQRLLSDSPRPLILSVSHCLMGYCP